MTGQLSKFGICTASVHITDCITAVKVNIAIEVEASAGNRRVKVEFLGMLGEGERFRASIRPVRYIDGSAAAEATGPEG